MATGQRKPRYKRTAPKGAYRSRLEDRIVPGAIERGAKYEPLTLRYTAERKYKPDLVLQNGIVIELKGHFTPADRAKVEAVLAAHPGLELRLVFERATNKLNPRSATTYAAWCSARAIEWAEKAIPLWWFQQDDFPLSLEVLEQAGVPVKRGKKSAA